MYWTKGSQDQRESRAFADILYPTAFTLRLFFFSKINFRSMLCIYLLLLINITFLCLHMHIKPILVPPGPSSSFFLRGIPCKDTNFLLKLVSILIWIRFFSFLLKPSTWENSNRQQFLFCFLNDMQCQNSTWKVKYVTKKAIFRSFSLGLLQPLSIIFGQVH